MSLTIACYTAAAFERSGYDARQNHDECRARGGVVYEMPTEALPGSIQLGEPCRCPCHKGQNRSWYPREPSRWSRHQRQVVKPAPGIGATWTFDL